MIAVTGLGLISALGGSVVETWKAMRENRTGLGALSLFDSPQWRHVPVAQVREPCTNTNGRFNRCQRLALCAAGRAMEDADARIAVKPIADRFAVAVGTCTGGMLESEQILADYGEDFPAHIDRRTFQQHPCSAVTDALAEQLGLHGRRTTVSDACASGGSAIAMACDWLNLGLADRVLAGGVDVITRLTLHGFGSLMILDEKGCRPFDADRRGMSLGEGAAFFVLEREADARKRGATIHAHVAGWSCRCDAHHVSRPSGVGIRQAMRSATEMARLSPAQVDYINAHGSGTIDNDRVEAEAIHEVFGDHPVPVSSTKHYFGHTLGAAGAIEAVVSVLVLREQSLPPNLGMTTPDTRLPVHLVTAWQNTPVLAAMSNSLGFGGANASLVFTRAQAP